VNGKEAIVPLQSQNEKPIRGDEATRWKPGQSGNPGGRPKRTPLIDACREVLNQLVPGDAMGRTYAQAIAEKLAAKAVAGDIRAAQELADRAEGKARQTLQIENTTLKEAFERMSDEELDEYARDGKLPTWFPQLEGKNDEHIQEKSAP
jgi:hypothetical protein